MSDRDADNSRRRRIDSVIPELLKRAVELGVEKATEAPDTFKTFVHDMKMPKELASALLQQVDDTKQGLFRVVAKEMRDFLEHANLAEEMTKLLGGIELEVKATVGFKAKAPPEKLGENQSETPATKAEESRESSASERRRRKAD